jgi:hypothetical protein
MTRFLKDPFAGTSQGSAVLVDLIYGWGNEDWSAQDEFLAGCIEHALTTRGPILECGSGLSTILVGVIAKQQGRSHWALEHKPEWAAKIKKYLGRYKLDSVTLCTKPLKDHGEFCWYDPPADLIPDNFSLVICDGPPGSTKGGRYGLAPIMKERLKPGCVILLDDAGRQEEIAISRRWKAELGARAEMRGSAKPYIEMTVRDRPSSIQGTEGARVLDDAPCI